jgi:stress response protein YsnF
MSPGAYGCARHKETIQETIRREGVDVDESGKTARREKGTGKESL